MSDYSDFRSSTGNPIVSGTVTGTNLVLTLQDASTVTIGATAMVNNGVTTTISLPNWYQTYANPGGGSNTAGAQINTTTPPNTANPYYYGVTLKRGREFAFPYSTASKTIWYGIWNGTTSYTPADAGKAAYWDKHLNVAGIGSEWRHGSDQYDSVGWDLTTDYSIIHGTTQCVLQYDYGSNKLKMWDVTGDYWHLAATTSVAEDGNPVIISCAVNSGGVVPNFTDREQDWNVIAEAVADAEGTWRDGVLTNTVLRHNRGLHPGEKMVISTPTHWAAQYFGFDYTGTSTGQTGVQAQNTACIQVASNERLYEERNFTINTKAERYDSSDYTIGMSGARISVRYHLNNSIDIFDEDKEDVLFTKDVNGDGSTIFMHMYFSTNANIDQLFTNWTFEPFATDWYYFAGNYNLKANEKLAAANLTGLATRVSWGQKLYPGQELFWTNVATQNIDMGTRRPDDTAYVTSVEISATKFQASGSVGTDLATRYPSGYTHSDKKVVLRYNFVNHKLQWLDVNTTGVETLVAEADTAEDGGAVTISCSGTNAEPPTCSQYYYGWEYKHVLASSPQSWENWRIDRPAANDRIVMDTVLQYRQALIPGRYFQWATNANDFNHFNGGWKSSNATTGLSNVEVTNSYWDWGWYSPNTETIFTLIGMTHNTSNSNYDSGAGGFWDDPNPGTTLVRLRYKSDNSVDIYDQSNSEVIATKTANLDGSPFYLAIGLGAGITSTGKLHGGGDLTSGTL